MPEINLVPYIPIEDTGFNDSDPDPVILRITPEQFNDVIYRPDTATFSFINCRFDKLIIENESQIDFPFISIMFYRCYIEHIEVESINSNISLNFGTSIFSGRISSLNLSYVHIHNCIANGGVFLLRQQTVDIIYDERSIHYRIWKNLLSTVAVSLKELIDIPQSFYIYDTQKVTFRNEALEHKTRVYKRGYELSEEHKIGYAFSQEQKRSFQIKLAISHSSSDKDHETIVSGSYLEALSLSGVSHGKISIEKTKINNLFLSDWIPTGDISFYDVQPKNIRLENVIGIHKCNLDKVSFDNVDFDSYKRISLYRSKVSNAIFTSCNFPDKYSRFEKFMPIENVHYPKNEKINPKDQYEIFLQLKKAFENTGNYYEALKFHAISHQALKRVKSLRTGDRIILAINKISNNHGLSIGQPFLLFLGFSIAFYLLYLKSLSKLYVGSEIDWKLVGYYFSFIDITHRTDFLVEKEEFTGLALTIDALNKILIGFFIYQFVAAFRKYGKK